MIRKFPVDVEYDKGPVAENTPRVVDVENVLPASIAFQAEVEAIVGIVNPEVKESIPVVVAYSNPVTVSFVNVEEPL